MTGARRFLLVAGMLALGVSSSAPASLWHRAAKKPEQPAAAAAAAMTLNAIEIGSTASPQIVLRTSGAPAFTSLSPTPDQFVIDLSGTTKAAGLTIPSQLPPGVSSITADEVTEMGAKLTRVVVKFAQSGIAQASADGNSVVIALPAAPAVVAEAPAPAPVEVTPIADVPKPAATPATVPAAPVEKAAADSKPLPKAKVLKKIETSGSGSSMDVSIATDGTASYSAFKLTNPARVVIDLTGIKDTMAKRAIDVDNSVVKRIRSAQYSPEVTRVVLDLSEPAAYNITKDGAKLHVTFGDAAPAQTASVEPVPDAAPVQTASIEPVPPPAAAADKPAPAPEKPAKSPDQIPAIAQNATWKMPADDSQGATAVIHAQDQVPPPPAATTIAQMQPAPAPAPMSAPTTLPGENVFNEPQVRPQLETPIAGSRQLSTGGKTFTGEPISLNLKDADIKDVLRTFQQLTGLNIAVDPDVHGSVTVDFTDVPWDQALDLILRQNHLTYTLEGNIMRVGTIATLSEEAAANRRLEEEERLNVPMTTVSFKLSYARASDVAALLKDMASPRARILVDQRTNQLIVSEIPGYLATMRNLIASVDVANRQVVIEARIVQTRKTFIQQWGFNWGFRGTLDPSLGTGTGLVFPSTVDVTGGPFEFGAGVPVLSFSLGNVLGTFNLDMALLATESEGLARVISAPRVQTQDNVAAEIQSGTQIPFQTRINFTTTISYVDATLRLTVTPQITEAGTVIMDIALQKTDPEPGLVLAGAAGTPLSTRQARTKLMVRDGGTAVIGGIYETTENRAETRMPFLHQIPIIGALFRTHDINNEYDELLIFITPRIVRAG
ncbi:MAG TPA: type IV pilus secretin PilQ [Thermoanaerobaculia bacterium]|nr:type IV pilus secretin PilQ [Thermoanaerobaculia bacterium]